MPEQQGEAEIPQEQKPPTSFVPKTKRIIVGVVETKPDNTRVAHIVHQKDGKITRLTVPLSPNGKNGK